MPKLPTPTELLTSGARRLPGGRRAKLAWAAIQPSPEEALLQEWRGHLQRGASTFDESFDESELDYLLRPEAFQQEDSTGIGTLPPTLDEGGRPIATRRDILKGLAAAAAASTGGGQAAISSVGNAISRGEMVGLLKLLVSGVASGKPLSSQVLNPPAWLKQAEANGVKAESLIYMLTRSMEDQSGSLRFMEKALGRPYLIRMPETDTTPLNDQDYLNYADQLLPFQDQIEQNIRRNWSRFLEVSEQASETRLPESRYARATIERIIMALLDEAELRAPANQVVRPEDLL